MSSSAPKLTPIVRGARRLFSGSVTRAKQATGGHLHRIEGYSLVDSTVVTGERITSEPFLVGGRKWQLLLYPNGVDAGHRDFVSADLRLAYNVLSDFSSAPATASYRVSILDYAGNPAHSHTVGPRRFSTHGQEVPTGIDELVAKEELRRTAPFILRDDRLNVLCDVAVLTLDREARNKWFMGLRRAFNGYS
ncbi:hypothetical protein ACP70R_049573 [Stipagrostis hirtigluma subsp. patula]